MIREGDPTEQILDVIDKDADIAMLVLAANPGPEGPGPIITMIASAAGSFPIPVTIVPGDLATPISTRCPELLRLSPHERGSRRTARYALKRSNL